MKGFLSYVRSVGGVGHYTCNCPLADYDASRRIGTSLERFEASDLRVLRGPSNYPYYSNIIEGLPDRFCYRNTRVNLLNFWGHEGDQHWNDGFDGGDQGDDNHNANNGIPQNNYHGGYGYSDDDDDGNENGGSDGGGADDGQNMDTGGQENGGTDSNSSDTYHPASDFLSGEPDFNEDMSEGTGEGSHNTNNNMNTDDIYSPSDEPITAYSPPETATLLPGVRLGLIGDPYAQYLPRNVIDRNEGGTFRMSVDEPDPPYSTLQHGLSFCPEKRGSVFEVGETSANPNPNPPRVSQTPAIMNMAMVPLSHPQHEQSLVLPRSLGWVEGRPQVLHEGIFTTIAIQPPLLMGPHR